MEMTLVQRKPLANKNDSLEFTSSEESINIHKPFNFGTSHLKMPETPRRRTSNLRKSISSLRKNANKENEGFSDSQSSRSKECDASDDLYNSEPWVRLELDSKKIVDKAFEILGDDPYAKLPYKSTPRATSPILLMSSESPKSAHNKDRYITNEEREAWKKDALDADDAFKIFVEAMSAKKSSSMKKTQSEGKSLKKVNFDCATPKAYSKIDDFEETPERGIKPETPLSGIKGLDASMEDWRDSPFNFSFGGKSTPCSGRESDTSFLCDSPHDTLPPEIAASLLAGITCFVDVRVGKENKTSAVQEELKSLGAKVEKNFTKKVTHIVFKEGRVSTYIKATKENIPIVGVLWIEACKKARGIVDPSQYRPRRMERYDNLFKHEMIPKRRPALLNPHSKVSRNFMLLCGETPPPTPERKRKRKAQTEVKKKRSWEDSEDNQSGERHINKKLFDEDGVVEGGEGGGEEVAGNSSSDNSGSWKELARLRRKSAPGKLLSKKAARSGDIKEYFAKLQAQKLADAEKSSTPTKTKVESPEEKKEEEDGRGDEGGTCKKRKLYNPEVTCDLQASGAEEQDEGSEGRVSSSEVYPPSTPPPVSGVRTKATAYRRHLYLKMRAGRKLAEEKRKRADLDDSSPSGTIFLPPGESALGRALPPPPPVITFTSVPKSEVGKYTGMVKELGKYEVEEKVTRRTTHVVSNGPRRTINLIKGIARGCWIVDLNWVVDSAGAGKWLPFEEYDLSSEYPVAAESCKVRRSLKSSRALDVFSTAGKVYVSRKLKCSPHWRDLMELVQLCGGHLVQSRSEADVVVGKESSSKGRGPRPPCVTNKWVLDCITHNKLLPFTSYLNEECLSQESQAQSQISSSQPSQSILPSQIV